MGDKKLGKEDTWKCYHKHRDAAGTWEHGFPEKSWIDGDGNLCIRYLDGKWWHYKESNGEIEWW